MGPHVEATSKGTMILRGTELACEVTLPPAIGGATSTVPQGGVIASMPLNPLYCDGMRVSRTLRQYDQFRVRKCVFEYSPQCPSTQAGGLIGAVVNSSSDNPSLTGGTQALRDMMSRIGSDSFNVYTPAAVSGGTPQQKWYFTVDGQDPFLVNPGFFFLMSSVAQSNATASAIPLGIVWWHYEIEVRAPSMELPNAQTFYTQSGTLSFGAVARTAGDQVFCGVAAFDIPAVFQDPSAIGWCQIVSAADVTTTVWRTWKSDTSPDDVTITPGMVIFFRATEDGYYLFYPTLQAAIQGGNASLEPHTSGFQFTATEAASAVGFKVWNVQGLHVGPQF